MKERVLFVCIHNSARSQMAEAFLHHYASDRYEVFSAGLESGQMNPRVVQAMQELDVSMEGQYAKPITLYVNDGSTFDYVITVCDESNAERCPLFPGKSERLHWSFPDPSVLKGDEESIMNSVREIRDMVHERILEWIGKESN
ncbi:MAG: arsenate reductase ArsC [Sphaerochaetaceae bacterium]|nr:arsenate reductase ArsC [Sphaerochaetaceae bacterium]